jgi:hypothetical protein
VREQVRQGEQDERQHEVSPPRAEPPAAALALRLQRTAGNQATARMVQRFSVSDLVAPGLEMAFEYGVWGLFVGQNRAAARYFPVPAEWRHLAGLYSLQNPDDGKWIRDGITRMPDFWIGGGLLAQAGSETHAITLDHDVFFNPDTRGEPSVDTFVHELIHVAQYGKLGIVGFLGTYAAEFGRGYIQGNYDSDAAYHNIVHEQQAVAVEERFSKWRQEKEAREAEEAKNKPKELTELEQADEALHRPPPDSVVGDFALSGSVGAKGDNRPADVARIADRLHGLGFLTPRTTDIDAVTEAIERYQSEVLRWPRPDARVDVDNKTHRALKAGRKTGSMAL